MSIGVPMEQRVIKGTEMDRCRSGRLHAIYHHDELILIQYSLSNHS